MIQTKDVFFVFHSYSRDGHDVAKFIGLYSSRGVAEQQIEILKTKRGFRLHQNGFSIHVVKLNRKLSLTESVDVPMD